MTCSSNQMLLVIAPVGDPASWRLAEYNVGEERVKSCCSAIALITAKAQQYKEAKLAIYAIDSILCSSIQQGWRVPADSIPRQDMQERLKQLFTGELENVARSLKTEVKRIEKNKITIGDCTVTVEVILSQAAGEFTINNEEGPIATAEFKGDPTAIFWKILSTQLTKIHDNTKMILDLTHGINYMQSMGIYAVDIIKTIKNLKGVEMHNASPYPATTYATKRCFDTTQRTPQIRINQEPTLNFLNITKISEISSLAKGLSNLVVTREDANNIKKAIDEVRQDLSPSLIQNIRHATLTMFYLSQGITTIAYYNLSKIDIEKTQGDHEEYLEKIEVEEGRCITKQTGHKLTIEYVRGTKWTHAIPTIMTAITKELEKLAAPIKKPKDGKVTVEMDELIKLVEKLASRNPIYNIQLEALRYEKRRMLAKSKEYSKKEFSMENREDAKIVHSKTGEPLSLLERTEMVRHLRAHAGITYEPIIHVKINEKIITLTINPRNLTEDPLKTWSA